MPIHHAACSTLARIRGVLVRALVLGSALGGPLTAALAQSVTFNFTTLNPAADTFVTCTVTDRCATDAGAALRFSTQGLTVNASGLTRSATGASSAAVAVQDYNGTSTLPWVGLGVYRAGTPYDSSTDNIRLDDVLKLDFGSSVVTLNTLSFLNAGHAASFDTAGTWGLSLTAPAAGSSVQTYSFTGNGVTTFSTGITGSTFYFHGLSDAADRQFYLSSIQVTAVPEPGSLAMLASGLLTVAWVARRRRPRRA
ncbi:MAG: hypothetical protein RI988_221 [Pseudomonadota bacterium]|jgi:hypothetical protein